jgi:hypothetical protein
MRIDGTLRFRKVERFGQGVDGPAARLEVIGDISRIGLVQAFRRPPFHCWPNVMFDI